jgi:hypothetical protein
VRDFGTLSMPEPPAILFMKTGPLEKKRSYGWCALLAKSVEPYGLEQRLLVQDRGRDAQTVWRTPTSEMRCPPRVVVTKCSLVMVVPTRETASRPARRRGVRAASTNQRIIEARRFVVLGYLICLCVPTPLTRSGPERTSPIPPAAVHVRVCAGHTYDVILALVL